MAVAAKLECYAEADRLQEKHGKSLDYDTYTDGPWKDVWKAVDDLVVTVPTTVPGLMSMLIYAHEFVPENDSGFWTESGLTETLIETLATTAKCWRAPSNDWTSNDEAPPRDQPHGFQHLPADGIAGQRGGHGGATNGLRRTAVNKRGFVSSDGIAFDPSVNPIATGCELLQLI